MPNDGLSAHNVDGVGAADRSRSSNGVVNSPAASRPSTAAQFALSPTIAFVLYAACHSLAAVQAPVQDCDEVFNYWEPTHYLTNGNGFQTWEYAPRYAIRSWAYAGLHALPIALIQQLWQTASPTISFYSLRILLGILCAACETKLFTAISKTLNERVAILFLFVMSTSPGMYHASVAYLPSSFAMYASMLGASFFMDWSSSYGTSAGILCFGVGSILGWPFAGALIVPFLVEELVLAIRGSSNVRSTLLKRWTIGAAQCLLILGCQTAIDTALYRKLVIVPLNIVLYNIFSTKGPDLYGTEPWHFYLRNLALNFHVWLVFALAALPLLILQPVLLPGRDRRNIRGYYLTAPLYLWLIIFTLQPHKEERFMYPAYPFIGLNAAYSFHLVLGLIGSTRPGSLAARIPIGLRLTAVLLFILAAFVISTARIAGTWAAYSAPLVAYQPLSTAPLNATVCLGKEWYRFPSHYLLPNNIEARFIRSEFRGLLPGQFIPEDSVYPFSAASTHPPGMNDDNLEDLDKYVDVSECDYIVDSHLPSTVVTTFEPDFVHDTAHWRKLHCVPFLDASSTGILGRLSWLPDSALIPMRVRPVWGEYCLLKRIAPG